VALSTDQDARIAAESERALLGALLLDSAKAWPQIKDVVSESDFVRADHRTIFGAIAWLMEDGGVADPVLVVDRMSATGQLEPAGGSEYIAQLYADCPSAVNAAAYARNVRAAAGRSKVVEIFPGATGFSSVEDALRFAQEQVERLRREQAAPDIPLWPYPLNLEALLATEPQRPPMLIEDWLPAGYATMIAGHGGAGKSSIALHLAAAIAQGRAWCGLSTAARRVVYLSCEDRVDVLHWRLDRICRREGWNAAALSGLMVRDLVGHEAILYRSSFDGLQPTRAYTELARIMADDPGALLVVDGVSDTYGGNENDRGQVKTFVNALVRLVNRDGAVMLVHHVNKQGANAAVSEGYSGSTGWHNSVRARWYLRPQLETDEDGNSVRADGQLLLELQKTNHGRTDQQIEMRWDDDAHMFVATAAATRVDASLQDTEERAGIMRALRDVVVSGGYVPTAAQGPRTAYHVLMASPDLPKSLQNRAGKRRFARHLEELRRIGSIRVDVIRRKDRHLIEVFVAGTQAVAPFAGDAGNT